jgi:hypothetical protein
MDIVQREIGSGHGTIGPHFNAPVSHWKEIPADPHQLATKKIDTVDDDKNFQAVDDAV